AYTVGKLLYLPPRAIVLLDLLSHCFSFHCCGPLCVLHSFPTRRSSDLAVVPHYLFGDRRRALHAAAPRAPGAVVRMNRSTIRKLDRKSTRLNSSHLGISYAVFCLKKKKKFTPRTSRQPIWHSIFLLWTV